MTTEPMTAQQVFDTVVQHLHDQKQPATNSHGECRYRTNNGLKCAVGCLIRDDEYDGRMEGVTLSGLCSTFPVVASRLGHFHLLSKLQGAHDHSFQRTANLIDRLSEIAVDQNLSRDLLDSLPWDFEVPEDARR